MKPIFSLMKLILALSLCVFVTAAGLTPSAATAGAWAKKGPIQDPFAPGPDGSLAKQAEPGEHISLELAADLTKAALKARKKSGETQATISLLNPNSIPLESMEKMVSTAGAVPLWVNADHTDTKERQLIVRMGFDPAQATRNIDLRAATGSRMAQRTKEKFEGWYSNKLMVVCLDQNQDFGMPIRYTVYLDEGLGTPSLTLYAYDRFTNTLERIDTEITISDQGSYAFFTTSKGGALVLSRGALTSR